MAEEENMKDILKKINEKIDTLSEKKENKSKLKIPFGSKLSKPNLKRNYINVIYIKENGHFDVLKLPIEKGTIEIDGVPRISTADCILNYKNKPFMILPSWSLKPFIPQEDYEETVKDKWGIAGRKLIIDRMHRDAIDSKKKNIPLIWWIILGMIVIGAGYYLFSGGKLF